MSTTKVTRFVCDACGCAAEVEVGELGICDKAPDGWCGIFSNEAAGKDVCADCVKRLFKKER